jgi:hypothetical protein
MGLDALVLNAETPFVLHVLRITLLFLRGCSQEEALGWPPLPVRCEFERLSSGAVCALLLLAEREFVINVISYTPTVRSYFALVLSQFVISKAVGPEAHTCLTSPKKEMYII